MNKQLALFLFIAFCSGSGSKAISQTRVAAANQAPWASDRGFWVVEGNVHTPKKNTVFFYTPDKQLVYKEQIDGMRLRLHKKKVLMHLKSVLETSVATWQAQQQPVENETLVATALRKKR